MGTMSVSGQDLLIPLQYISYSTFLVMESPSPQWKQALPQHCEKLIEHCTHIVNNLIWPLQSKNHHIIMVEICPTTLFSQTVYVIFPPSKTYLRYLLTQARVSLTSQAPRHFTLFCHLLYFYWTYWLFGQLAQYYCFVKYSWFIT